MGGDQDGWYVKSVEKTFAVLEAFTVEAPLRTVSDVAAAADLSRAAARRFLLTLTHLGYLAAEDGRFRLAPRSLDIGSAFLNNLTLPAIAEPHLKALAGRLQETTSLCVLDGDHVVYVARVSSPRLVSVSVNVGTRFPAWATSMGRVLLAHLEPEAREQHLQGLQIRPFTSRTLTGIDALRSELEAVRGQGWSVVRGELEEGLSGVAVPVRLGSRVVAAANVSLHRHRGPDDVEATVLPALRESAENISADYGIRPPAS